MYAYILGIRETSRVDIPVPHKDIARAKSSVSMLSAAPPPSTAIAYTACEHAHKTKIHFYTRIHKCARPNAFRRRRRCQSWEICEQHVTRVLTAISLAYERGRKRCRIRSSDVRSRSLYTAVDPSEVRGTYVANVGERGVKRGPGAKRKRARSRVS